MALGLPLRRPIAGFVVLLVLSLLRTGRSLQRGEVRGLGVAAHFGSE